MPIIQILESHPDECNLWVREVLCIRIMGRTIPLSSRSLQMQFVYDLDQSTRDLDTLRDRYLDVWELDNEWLVYPAVNLVTPIGKSIKSIADDCSLEYAGIYMDHDNLDVFVCSTTEG